MVDREPRPAPVAVEGYIAGAILGFIHLEDFRQLEAADNGIGCKSNGISARGVTIVFSSFRSVPDAEFDGFSCVRRITVDGHERGKQSSVGADNGRYTTNLTVDPGTDPVHGVPGGNAWFIEKFVVGDGNHILCVKAWVNAPVGRFGKHFDTDADCISTLVGQS